MTTITEPRYRKVTVRLVGEDGNAFAIMGRVSRALRRAGVPDAEVQQFHREAASAGSYDTLLYVVQRWVSVE